VILKDPEYRKIQRVARRRRMSIAEWVRQALDVACQRESVGKKLAVIRAAARHDYPSGDIRDIHVMLADIEGRCHTARIHDFGGLEHSHAPG
jgi:hypothetical protein